MSAYLSNYVVSVLGPNGTPLREHNDLGLRTARLGWNSEYKLRLKNKSTYQRAIAEVWIDGTCCTPAGLILQAGQTLDLERFLSNGSLTAGPRFKFVSTQQGAQDGSLQDPDSPLNGQIRVVFRPEALFSRSFYQLMGAAQHTTFFSCATNSTQARALSDQGGTADGSMSSQSFHHAASFPTGDPVEISIWLKGPEAPPKSAWEVQMTPQGPNVFCGGTLVGSIGAVEFTQEGGLILKIPTYHLRQG